MNSTSISTNLSDESLKGILERVGIEQPVPHDITGLTEVYSAWCHSVPFDNLRKMIALLENSPGPLPGSNADDFFDNWLHDGCGGTCWAISNALYTVVQALGFNTRRVAGSMRDTGIANHGSVKVRLDDSDWLIDSSMLTNKPLPLATSLWANNDSIYGAEIEPVDGTHIIWFDVPPHDDFFPCRIMVDPADHGFYAEHYENSRVRSPFNSHLYARRNRQDGMIVLRGPERFHKTERGVEHSRLTRDEVVESLRNEIGISESLIRRWIECGGLDATFQPPTGPLPPPVTTKSPSQRVRTP